MICSHCQRPLTEGALFCSICGVSTVKINLDTTVINPTDTDPNAKRSQIDPQFDPRIGLVLDSKYELLERLGQGGMGAVYRARRLHIGDEVAVKLLSREMVREHTAIERFRREARSAAMIRHPNVVSIHDFGDASTGNSAETYIVMELIKGESLRQLIAREGRLHPERATSLLRDICAGVGLAHRQGLLHRDLKPDNVIVSPPASSETRENVKVVDFGLAKIREENISPLTEAGIVLGTIYYMSPEQCRGEQLDARADVYSLGAMLYEMLSGVPPFQSPSITGLIFKHLNEFPSPFNQTLQVPPALERVCFRALAKSPQDRQADATALSSELQEAMAPQVQSPRTPIASEPVAVARKSSSNAWKWVVAVVGTLVVSGILIAGAIALKFGLDKFRNENTAAQQVQSQTTSTPQETKTNASTTETTIGDLRGTWTGTYGPLGQTATLTIKNHKGEAFEGVLEQGEIQVAFKGTIESDRVHMKQSRVLSGSGWSLGEDTGTVSSDGKRMSGTGKDEMGGSLGLTYQWSFSREL
jgi:eukaryotic-like serine/threonine-protein kinase